MNIVTTTLWGSGSAITDFGIKCLFWRCLTEGGGGQTGVPEENPHESVWAKHETFDTHKKTCSFPAQWLAQQWRVHLTFDIVRCLSGIDRYGIVLFFCCFPLLTAWWEQRLYRVLRSCCNVRTHSRKNVIGNWTIILWRNNYEDAKSDFAVNNFNREMNKYFVTKYEDAKSDSVVRF